MLRPFVAGAISAGIVGLVAPLIATFVGESIRLPAAVGIGLLAGLVTGCTVFACVRGLGSRLDALRADHVSLTESRADLRLQSRSAVIQGLAKLAESRDDATGQHLDRIRQYVRILAEALREVHDEVDAEFVETVVETSALHDIGKVGVPDHVLLHPGELSDEQFEVIKRHTTIGGDTLLAVKRRWGDDPFLVTACEVVFAHHERYDGTGYPFGLAGDLIPLAARIVAVADVYDALTNRRVYKEALGHDAAAEMIESGRGTQFDPVIVDVFVETAEAFRAAHARFEASG